MLIPVEADQQDSWQQPSPLSTQIRAPFDLTVWSSDATFNVVLPTKFERPCLRVKIILLVQVRTQGKNPAISLLQRRPRIPDMYWGGLDPPHRRRMMSIQEVTNLLILFDAGQRLYHTVYSRYITSCNQYGLTANILFRRNSDTWGNPHSLRA